MLIHCSVLGQVASDTVSVQTDTLETEDSFITYLKSIVDTNKVEINYESLPQGAFVSTENFNVRGVDVKDLLRGIGRQYDINVLVDNNIDRMVTLRLSELTVIEALIQICQEYDLSLIQTGQIFRIREFLPAEPEPIVEESLVQFNQGSLTLDLKDIELREFARRMSSVSGENIIVRNAVRGTLNGYLRGIDFDIGLNTILANNGYSLREKDGVYIIFFHYPSHFIFSF